MGREIKRVPLDFDWPLDKVWEGYLNPHYKPCPDPHCKHGYTPARELFNGLVRLILLAGSDAAVGPQSSSRRIWPHPYFQNIGYRSFDYISPDAAELSTGLAGREPSFMGHDSCDSYSAEKKIIAAAGLPDTWGLCPTCKGSAVDPESSAAYENWKPTEPPNGDGWQIWETVSEGSPITPVFAAAEELVEHLVQTGTSPEAARAFVRQDGWVPSFVTVGGKMYEGIESAAIDGRSTVEREEKS